MIQHPDGFLFRGAWLIIAVLAMFFFALHAAAKAEETIASFYGYESGRQTASGERFNPEAMTAAHRTLPFGTRVTVTNLANGKSVTVRITDRGPFVKGRGIDLALGAARVIGMVETGVARVSLTY